MTFGAKLKSLRKTAGFSQEKLAEKLGVSRQAITKWENDAGIPDIENIMALSALFSISMDELLIGEKQQNKSEGYLFESVTEYDIDRPKHYDMKFGGAKSILLSGYEGEKIRIRLASNQLSTLQSDFKLKIDDVRDRIDLDISRKNSMTEAKAKEALIIFVSLPMKYIRRIELAAGAGNLELSHLKCDEIEMDIKTGNLLMDDVIGNVEVNCNLDMRVECRTLQGALELNQISAASKVFLPQGCQFKTIVKGIGNNVSYEENGSPCENFSEESAENIVMLNGMRSELIITRAERGKE